MTPALTPVEDEASELFCDRAESILRDALESENELRRDVASRFVLSGKGPPRGWSRPLSPAMTIEQPPRQIVIKTGLASIRAGEPSRRELSSSPSHRRQRAILRANTPTITFA
jgi:hypothetical protein